MQLGLFLTICRNQLTICFELYLFPFYSNKCPGSIVGTFSPFEKVVESFRYHPNIHSTTFLPLCPLQILFTLVHLEYFLRIWKLLSLFRIHFFKTSPWLGKILWIFERFLTSIHWRSLCIYAESLWIFLFLSISCQFQIVFIPFSFLEGMT